VTGPQTITAAEAARRLGVNKSTMTRWIAAGQVPAIRQGGRWRVRTTWVDAEQARLAKT
jgi:excisionase family DNA binding protein